MRALPRTGWHPVLPWVLAGALAAGPASAVTITCGSGSGLAGQTVSISITSSDLTGLNVTSYQFVLSYDPNQVTATGVDVSGTLTAAAGWSTPTFAVLPGRISVSAAGTGALSGSGTLLKLDFLLNPALVNGGGSGLNWQSFLMNEGSPSVTTTNGGITINGTPQIFVSPNSAEIYLGQNVQFFVGGGVTNPVSWGVTNSAVATIGAGGLLTGVGAGATRVFAVDAATRRDTTDADILVRVAGVTVGSASVLVGQSASIPVTVTSLPGVLSVPHQARVRPAAAQSAGIRSGQFSVSFSPGLLTLTSVTAPAGTLLHNYGELDFGVVNGTVTVGFAGTTDLTGSGVLFYLNFATSPSVPGYTGLALNTALFNETLPAVRTSGSLAVNPLPAIFVNPDVVTLLALQTQQFSLSGSPTPPITWSTLDPTVATINSSGLLSAVASGTTKVHAADNVGAVDDNSAVVVYDFQLTLGTGTGLPGSTVHVPLNLDRSIGALGVYSLQYNVGYDPTWITSVSAGATGLISTWGPPTTRSQSGLFRVAAAGNHALPSGSTVLHNVDFKLSSSAPPGTDIPLALSGMMFNEGRPAPFVVNGLLRVRTNAEAGGAGTLSFSLAAPQPNPAGSSARIPFTLPPGAAGGEPVSLAVYGLDGRRVRTLVDGIMDPGLHEAIWDARDDAGRAAPTGIYFCRLAWRGHSLERKLALVR